MFPRMNITTPLSPFAYCPPQYGAGVGFGGINPMIASMVNPYLGSPIPVPYPVVGPSPYAVQSAIPCPPGVIPYPPGQIGAGIAPWCSPLSWSPYAPAQPTYSIPGDAPGLREHGPGGLLQPGPMHRPGDGSGRPATLSGGAESASDQAADHSPT